MQMCVCVVVCGVCVDLHTHTRLPRVLAWRASEGQPAMYEYKVNAVSNLCVCACACVCQRGNFAEPLPNARLPRLHRENGEV